MRRSEVRMMRHSVGRFLIIGLAPALLLIFSVRPLLDSTAVAGHRPQLQQKYIFLNIIGTGQPAADLERYKSQFIERIEEHHSDLDVKPQDCSWVNWRGCTTGPNIDQITIDLHDQQLLIRCTERKKIVREPLPVPGCPHEKNKCIQSLPLKLPSKLWKHDGIHRDKSKQNE